LIIFKEEEEHLNEHKLDDGRLALIILTKLFHYFKTKKSEQNPALRNKNNDLSQFQTLVHAIEEYFLMPLISLYNADQLMTFNDFVKIKPINFIRI